MLDRSGTGAAVSRDFRSAFRLVAAFLGRPSSDSVLFSGIPEENLLAPDHEEVVRLAERIGLDVVEHSPRALRAGDVELPAIVLFADGDAVALLEQASSRSFRTGHSPGDIIDEDMLARRGPVRVFLFSATYINASEDAGVGDRKSVV